MTAPAIIGISPVSGNVGTTGIKLTGSDLDQAPNALYFNDIDVSEYITYIDSDQIRFQVPHLVAGVYKVQVVNSGGESNVF